jgi:hypothetical protein
MEAVVLAARCVTVGFLAGLTAIVLWKLLTGGIRTGGVLAGRRARGAEPMNVQLFLVTLAAAASLLARLPEMRETRTISLPDTRTIPGDDVVLTYAGSMILYLLRQAKDFSGRR